MVLNSGLVGLVLRVQIGHGLKVTIHGQIKPGDIGPLHQFGTVSANVWGLPTVLPDLYLATLSIGKGRKFGLTQYSPAIGRISGKDTLVWRCRQTSGFYSHLTVAICSRESTENYEWIINLLQTEEFNSLVKEPQSINISNNFSQFLNDVSGYTFAILYHSKRRGRLNITDVTDSLYDKELEYLYGILGKDKVIVVIDDLVDSSESEKNRILQSQKSIGQWASDLFLFSVSDKDSIKSQSQDKDVEEKRKKLYNILSQGNNVNGNFGRLQKMKRSQCHPAGDFDSS
ncbi:hypothetical protein XELAEV_18000157mg [Xenopus laevis]|uniref:Uncharacterized protein n=1 Tax=Xenopus laevis TaxID=8355 RepID=A0A974GZB6_XENLA|nr:hypothetical protein XELAEV_18000157mg [Xenopus laevis]